MTKSNITQYDNTAANNTDVEDVPLGENLMYPSHVNNAFREIMADLADINDGTVTLTSPAAGSINITGNITVGGTVDGRDIATDGAKLDGVEASADVTDTANVTAAGAAMLTGATFTGSITAPDATFNGTTAVKLPAGTDAQRPTGVNGMLRYNSDDAQFEGYADGAWGAIAGGGETSFLLYSYTATSGQTTFTGSDDNSATLSYTAANLMVTLNGIVLENGTDYAATNGTSIVLTVGAAAGDELNVIAFKSFTVSDTVAASTGGTFSGNVAVTGDLTVDTNTLYVDSTNNRVGVGTLSPARELSIGDGTGSPNIQLLAANTGNSRIEFGDTDDSDVGEIQYLHGDNAMLFHVNATERMRIDSSGKVGIGGNTRGSILEVKGSAADNSYIFTVLHDGNSTACRGMEILSGTDDNSGTNVHIDFRDGNGTFVGRVSSTSGTVTYGPFTAMHPCILPDADNDTGYPYGTLLETVSLSYTQKNGADTERGLIYNVRKTQSANSKAVLGAYGSSENDTEEFTNRHQVLVLGDGHILCNNSGGNISMGDGICSSAVAGIGQKATANPSMIIGIAQEDVTFADDTETKLVAVQYGLQQFIPWS